MGVFAPAGTVVFDRPDQNPTFSGRAIPWRNPAENFFPQREKFVRLSAV
jgi:hypothetical protein